MINNFKTTVKRVFHQATHPERFWSTSITTSAHLTNDTIFTKNQFAPFSRPQICSYFPTITLSSDFIIEVDTHIQPPSIQDVFSPINDLTIESYELQDFTPSLAMRFFPEKTQIQPHHLALLNLFPTQTIDFHKLLDFNGKSLYSYQKDGVRFLIEHSQALLADEMGLGKSIQAIVALRLLFGAVSITNCLILCPKSVLTDWANKFESWAPELMITEVSGSSAQRRTLWETPSQIYLTTYDSLKEDITALTETTTLEFDLVILDEIQRIKNSTTKTFHAVNHIQSRIRWGLSGTPLENRVEEIVTIFRYLNPSLFSSSNVTDSDYVKSLIAPFTLRRTKQAVLTELPTKTQENVLLDLSPKQRAVYNLVETHGVLEIKEKGSTATATHIMALISKLKQICNLEPVSGESCKLDYIEDVLTTLNETGDKMVLFSQYPFKTLQLIQPRLHRFNPLIYSGALSSKQRAAVVQQFEEDPTVRVLLISLKAGGLGLTLTAANYVAHFDSWWNPATMSQAEDRTHRIGQKKNVTVLSLISKHTIEERIQTILEEKKILFQEVVGDISEDGLSHHLTEHELFGLFGLQRAHSEEKQI
ncbi:MAG: DEAD/DEAH box helicase [Candidatus Bathyarchaeota archaeon]|nr:DEAD/DEAH box helicase [Candidatus Bathyarchaeota archaeon]